MRIKIVVRLTTLIACRDGSKEEYMTNRRMQKDKRRAVLYLRTASADQRDQRLAINEQRRLCTREAERLGAVITDEFVDVGASGNDQNRDELRHLLAALREQPVTYVIVRDHARLARKAADHMAIRRQLQRAAVAVVAVDNDYHTQVAVDELLESIR
jgi:DNA invertase Pin-like site-specific DNA recombinase